ncbi:hypothetical protein Ahy_A02g009743 [Arachis hypogaea]|uniref:Disease resistance N-terminal domain-containing protein n=1 Tax=Arachis hypogaea TaxID=3818 RepID=A0A445EHW3_ARAHY|nr:hypothetical protein Ahy_A02g009743 [Arachis hypogaea]
MELNKNIDNSGNNMHDKVVFTNSLMAEVVSGAASTLLANLATKSFKEIILAYGLKDEIKKFESSLRTIDAYLIDAENKEAKNHSIDEWLKQLREAFDDAGDILDEIEYEAKLNEVVKMYGTICTKVRRFFSYTSNPLAFRIRMAHKIKDMKQKMDEKIREGRDLGIVEQYVNTPTLEHNLAWRETASSLSFRFNYLRVLHLTKGVELSLLPDDCFATMKKHLRFLCLLGCPSLKKFPDSICKLQNLQSLWLDEFPKNMKNLVHLQFLFFLGIKITNLSSMNIGRFQQLKSLYLYCSNLVSVPSAVSRMTTLKKLVFLWCDELVNFEDEEEEEKQYMVVNNLNLQLFYITGSRKLDALPKWLERVTKLQYLRIHTTGIKSLPTRMPMTSLEQFYIHDRQKLSSLPNMDLIHNLQYLEIFGCPTLRARYNKQTGPDWPKIAHIPHYKL